jgi:hypothetical protein
VVFPTSSAYFFYFVGESFFATLKQKQDFFATWQQNGHMSAREAGGWEIKSPGGFPALPKKYPIF